MTSGKHDLNSLPSMRSQLVTVVVCSGGVFAFVFVFIAHSVMTRHLIQDQQTHYSHFLSHLRSSTTNAIIAEDVNVLADVAAEIVNLDPNIAGVTITNDERTPIVEVENGADKLHSRDFMRIDKNVQVSGTDTVQGVITLVIDLRGVRAAINDQILIFLVLLLLMLIVLLAVLWWMVDRTLLRPIISLQLSLKDLADVDRHWEVPVKHMASREMNLLTHTLDQQARRLREEYQDRLQAQAITVNQNNELQRTLVELEEAQDALVSKERLLALGEMAAGVAHDFSNNLTPIMVAADLLANIETLTAKRTEELVRMIKTAASDMAQLIEVIRADDKQSSSGIFTSLSVREAVVTAVEVAESKWASANADGTAKTVCITEDVDPTLRVVGQESLYRQAFINILMNSFDSFLEQGSISITGTRENNTVLLEFRDNGIGMPPDVLRKCMSPMFTTKGSLGTGLGLANVATIARQMGGAVNISSAPRTGTTVRISLPCSVPADASKSIVSHRVTVVDDDPAVRRVVALIIQRIGHQVTAVSTGAEALELMAGENQDLLLTDYAMPYMTGGELATRAISICPEMKVILMTGYRGQVMKDMLSPEDIFDEIIDKPLDVEALQSVVEAVLRKA
jgi:two-component system cell cycle sensor histidine kinase/response regulator CckA